MLVEFNVPSLSSRRIRAQQMYLFKTINGLIDNPDLLQLISFNIGKSNLRKRSLFYLQTTKTLSHKMSPLLLMLRTYNHLSNKQDLDFSLSYNMYKKKLCKALLETHSLCWQVF